MPHPSESEIRRLALVRRLYHDAARQSAEPPPGGSLAVLSFHDAVELFLIVASDHLGVATRSDETFMSLLNHVIEAGSVHLPIGRTQLRRLNSSRRELKHRGLLPSDFDVAELRESVHDLLSEMTRAIFGLELAEVSLSSHVQNDKVRRLLNAAEREAAAGELGRGLARLSEAYDLAVRSATQRLYGRRGGVLKSWISFSVMDDSELAQEVEMLADEVNDAFQEVDVALSTIALGIDYARYMHLSSGWPYKEPGKNGSKWYGQPTEWTENRFVLSLSFVTETVLDLERLGLVDGPIHEDEFELS